MAVAAPCSGVRKNGRSSFVIAVARRPLFWPRRVATAPGWRQLPSLNSGHAPIPLHIRAGVACGVSTPARKETVLQLILQLTEILGDIAIVNLDPLVSAPGAYPTESAPIQLEAADLLFVPFLNFSVFLIICLGNSI